MIIKKGLFVCLVAPIRNPKGKVIHAEIICASHVAQVLGADRTQSNSPVKPPVEMEDMVAQIAPQLR